MESYGPFSNDLNVFDYHGIGELSERGVKVLRRFNGRDPAVGRQELGLRFVSP
jgi:hypothetical protein